MQTFNIKSTIRIQTDVKIAQSFWKLNCEATVMRDGKRKHLKHRKQKGTVITYTKIPSLNFQRAERSTFKFCSPPSTAILSG